MQRTEWLDGLAVTIDEPDAGPPRGTVLLLHGWPDSAALWDATVAALAPHWRCLRFTLPGYAEGDADGAHPLDAIVGLIDRVATRLAGAEPITLLLHDWGCVFGYRWAQLNPQRVARVIGVDVGDAGSRAHQAALTLRAKLGVLGYQLWLALAWKIGGAWGDRMARRLAAAMHVRGDLSRIRARMGWPYWIAWMRTHGSFRALRPFDPAVPMLYLYGRRKPFQFHSQAWADALAQRPGSRVVGLKTGHWVMLDDPAGFQAEVTAWLDGGSG